MKVDIHTHSIHNQGISILNGNILNPTSEFASFGIHPADAMNPDYTFQKLESTLSLSNCIALGECGLDKVLNVDFSSQQRIFIQHVKLAEKFNKPMIIHCVKAWNEIEKIKKQLLPRQPWIFHGFRKTGILDQVLASGCYISIGPAILFDTKLQQVLPKIPLNRLFLETDNELTITIEDVYQQVATLLEIPIKELENQLLKSFKHHFLH